MTDDEQQDDTTHPNRCRCRARLTAGWYLCNKCGPRLADDLLEIVDRYHRLSAAPSMQPGKYDRSGSNKPGSRPPLNLNIVALRDHRSGRAEPTFWHGRDGTRHEEPERDTSSVLRDVAQWAGALAVEIEHQLPVARLEDVVDWLNRRDDYISRWWQAAEFAKHMRELRNRLRTATGEPNDRPIGNCIRFNYDEAGAPTLCDAPIFPPPVAPGMTPAVECNGRPSHRYDGIEITRLEEAIRIEREKKKREQQDGAQEAC